MLTGCVVTSTPQTLNVYFNFLHLILETLKKVVHFKIKEFGNKYYFYL